MIKAVLFSNFPEMFLAHVVKKLAEHGVDVEGRIFEAKRNSPLTVKCDVALFMHQMAGSADSAKVKKFADDNKLPLVMLPRQSAKWPGLLAPFAKSGKVERERAPEMTLRKGLLKKAPALEINPEDPALEISAPDAILGHTPLPPPPPPPPAPAPVSEVLPVAVRVVPPAPSSGSAIDALSEGDEKELVRLYEEENAKLKARVAGLEREVAHYRPVADALNALATLKAYLATAESHAQAAE